MHNSPAIRFHHIWVDTGGTFTDVLALKPSGVMQRIKVLSNSTLKGTVHRQTDKSTIKIKQQWNIKNDIFKGYRLRVAGMNEFIHIEKFNPEDSTITFSTPLDKLIPDGTPFELISDEEALILACRILTSTPLNKSLPPIIMRLGTTRGTNALLERRGAPVVLFVTKGFADILEIGTQQRPELFALNVIKPVPLYSKVIEVNERIDHQGNGIHSLDLKQLDDIAASIKQGEIQSAAVVFLHIYVNPKNEIEFAGYLKSQGFDYVTISSQVAPFINLLTRSTTTVVNAYLAPVIDAYLTSIQSSIKESILYVMTSAGGLVRSSSYLAKDSLLSGPAGGVVGAAAIARQSGFDKIISFDMGGTSTDAARYDGDYEYQFEHTVANVQLFSPSLAIETVAAGGGSICSFDGFTFSVGPQSAGAMPGPACYGAGGPLTLTDVNLLLGRLTSDNFTIPLSVEDARAKFEELLNSYREAKQQEPDPDDILNGFREIANERMADAIRTVSIRRGYDPADYALVAFGGAGGQHACDIASKLGIRKVIFPEDAGLLSAYGLGNAAIERFSEKQILSSLPGITNNLPAMWQELEDEAFDKMNEEGFKRTQVLIRRCIAHLRFTGQESTIAIECGNSIDLAKEFEKQYKNLYGHWVEEKEIEVVSLRVVASEKRNDTSKHIEQTRETYIPQPVRTQRAYFAGTLMDTPVFFRRTLRPGAKITGPAIILEEHSTSIIEHGWELIIDNNRTGIAAAHKELTLWDSSAHTESVTLELFTHRFQNIAREMGEILRRTSLSVNVKERLDFSCALLDPDGELIVNAPHIPVHLGSLGMCVRSVKQKIEMKPDDVVITNHPAFGGSHLPDVTLITPAYSDNGMLIGYAASRAHHAEIGGAVPGSMPPTVTRLVEEGVVIPPMYLIDEGKVQWDKIRDILLGSPFPTRSLQDNLADINAAVAANHRGVQLLKFLTEIHGIDKVHYYMNELKKYAASKMTLTLENIPDGVYESTEYLDDGTPLNVTITIKEGRAVFDFNGTGAQHPGNLNATPAIVASVIIYVLRLLIDEPLPLNEGLMKPVDTRIPAGILNPGFPDDIERCPAVVGGNVETSQRLVDTILKPFMRIACSQGTMNNVLFGNDRFGYYETICGGCGAGPDFDGASAVHHHMTNTRITDPEIIERRYPVILESFAIRKNSGGKGKHRGGDGVTRIFRFLEQLTLSVLTQHRTVKPYGLEGGEAGTAGKQYVIRSDGTIVNLKSIDGCTVNPGDRFVIETPGGGGMGYRR